MVVCDSAQHVELSDKNSGKLNLEENLNLGWDNFCCGGTSKEEAHEEERLQQRARMVAFWERTLDAGRQQQCGKQMYEAEREVSKKTPRLKV